MAYPPSVLTTAFHSPSSPSSAGDISSRCRPPPSSLSLYLSLASIFLLLLYHVTDRTSGGVSTITIRKHWCLGARLWCYGMILILNNDMNGLTGDMGQYYLLILVLLNSTVITVIAYSIVNTVIIFCTVYDSWTEINFKNINFHHINEPLVNESAKAECLPLMVSLALSPTFTLRSTSWSTNTGGGPTGVVGRCSFLQHHTMQALNILLSEALSSFITVYQVENHTNVIMNKSIIITLGYEISSPYIYFTNISSTR